ncbi:hypothetical protein DIPPA_04478 [Diplonema papillatum]|nr:hypothetical protein DIPPA_04478 [Diplonema papillatum]
MLRLTPVIRAGVAGTSSTTSPVAVASSQLAQKTADTPVGTPWKTSAELAEAGIGSASPYAVSYAYPSKSSNAPRLLDASHYKKMIPFQKTAWCPTADDVPVDSIAERPQGHLAVHFSRDTVEPIPVSIVSEELERQARQRPAGRLAGLWKRVRRRGRGDRYTEEGLLVRDERYWQWLVEDRHGFWGKPKHLTWEQFAGELESIAVHWEPHPTKPEDYYLMHVLRCDPNTGVKEVVWSAEHAAWQGPVLVDLFAAVGTMLSRRLKTRTLTFDNGRGTTLEFNVRHISPWTTATQVNLRPAYYYDPVLRDQREESAGWYFTKDLIAQPGIDEKGTVSFYISAEALGYHLSKSVQSLLERPMWTFYRRGLRRNAKRKSEVLLTDSEKVYHAAKSWAGWDDGRYYAWPALCQLDAVTDHWLEESPFPLYQINSKVRELSRLRRVNLERRQWVHCNQAMTKEATRSIVSHYAPSLLLGPGGAPSPLAAYLSEDTPTQRESVHKRLTAEQLEELNLLRAADDEYDKQSQLALEAEEKKNEKEEASSNLPPPDAQSVEARGRQRLAERLAEGVTHEDSEQWEWYDRPEPGAGLPEKAKVGREEDGTGAVVI